MVPVQGKAGLPTTITVLGRDVQIVLPNAYNAKKKYRIKIFLHSYGSNATSTLNRFFASSGDAANSGSGAIVLLPSGLLDNLSTTYWNSNDSCCGLDASSPTNDSTFLIALIVAVKAIFSVLGVDVYGYSNGAMMALTLALCASTHVEAVYCFAGYAPLDTDSKYCVKDVPVHVRLIHGDADTIVVFPGDPTGAIATDKPTGIYQGAISTANQLAALNGCSGSLTPYDTADLTSGLAGNETTRYSYPTQAVNGSVELWQVVGGSHVQGMNTNFFRAIELAGYQCLRV